MAKVTGDIGKTRFATTLRTQSNELLADEPITHGGGESGFSPGELLAASLVACTNITLRMYADRKGWPLDAVAVSVDFHYDMATRTTKIERNIQLFGTLDEAQRLRLLQIAEKCPIHQALTHPITIHTALT